MILQIASTEELGRSEVRPGSFVWCGSLGSRVGRTGQPARMGRLRFSSEVAGRMPTGPVGVLDVFEGLW
jgi:hypothetical protein